MADPRIVQAIQEYVGGCREWDDQTATICAAPAEYVLWGKLIPKEGLGPRCYDHALKHLGSGGHHGLASGTSWALIHVEDLARGINAALQVSSDSGGGS